MGHELLNSVAATTAGSRPWTPAAAVSRVAFCHGTAAVGRGRNQTRCALLGPRCAYVLERLRATIGGYDFPQVGRVTISVGYTSTTCVERADAALYYAKSHGRDNVQNCEALIAAAAFAAKCNDGDVELF
jgi:hypothetical protein